MPHDKQSRKRWNSQLLSRKIREFRSLRHMTQTDVAEKMNVSESAVRNYELMRAFPSEEHLLLMADAFEIRPEALRMYDFSEPSIFVNSLFQICETYGLAPKQNEYFAYLVPTTSFMDEFLNEWNIKYKELCESVNEHREAYELWKDCYSAEYDPAEFPLRFKQVKGEITDELIPSWEQHLFSAKIKALREQQGETQEDFAKRIGLSTGVYRSYEQGWRLPRRSVVVDISKSLGIIEGALTFYDFGSPVQAAQALFQLSAGKALIPDLVDGQIILRGGCSCMKKIINQWYFATQGKYEGPGLDEVKTFEEWKDKYNPSLN